MKRKLLLLTAIFLSFSIVICACSPRLVSEAKAKEIGLGYINQIFDVNETEATVTLVEGPGLSYINGVHAQLGDEDPIQFYCVYAGPSVDGNSAYYAEVNAQTGVAYRAERNLGTISLSEEQQKQVKTLGYFNYDNSEPYLAIQKDLAANVWDFIQPHLEKDVPVYSVYPDMIDSECEGSPKILFTYIVVMDNNTIYTISLCWPSMDIISVQNRTSAPYYLGG